MPRGCSASVRGSLRNFYLASSTPMAREAYLDAGSLAREGRMMGAAAPITMPALEECIR